jgi:hypothetical protein
MMKSDVPEKTYLFPSAGGKKPLFLVVGAVKLDFLQFRHECTKSTLNFGSI